MSTALYRRYRPETFAEMIGQEHVTGPLSAALGRNRVNHAYLFSGPRGCGKTTSARILARCLNCEQGPTATPCGTCDSCVGLARGGAGTLDVIEIDAASHRGIDDAREIRDRAAFAPASSRYKIFIIDEAHQVTKEGFNALLKIVEEPPEHVKFVFATTEPDKVIGTIRSRTHHYPFRLVPPGVLSEYLGRLSELEGVAVGKGVLPLVVRAGGGSVRDSLSVLDQLIAGAGDDGLTYELAVALLGYTDGALLDAVVGALAAGDGATVFAVVDRVVESGHDPRRFVEDLLERLRDLVVVDAAPDAAAALLRGTADDQLDRMRLQASGYGRSALSRAADVVNLALTEMTGATSPRLQLELLCARLLLPGADDGERGLRARMDRLERRVGVPATPGAGEGMRPVPLGRPEPAQPVQPARPDQPTEPNQPAGPQAPSASPAPAPASSPAPGRPPAAAPAVEPAPAATSARPAADWPEPSRPGGGGHQVSGAAGSGVAGSGGGRAEPAAASDPGAAPAPGPGAPGQPDAAARADGDRAPAAQAAPAGPPGQAGPEQAGPEQVATAPEAGGAAGGTEQVRALWPQVLDALSQRKRATWTLLSQHAQVMDFDGQRLLLGFSSTGLANSFGRGGHQEFLRLSLIDVLGIDCRFEAVATDAPRGATAPQQAGRPADQARDQPTGRSAAPGRSAGPAPSSDAPSAAPAARPQRRPDPAPAARQDVGRPRVTTDAPSSDGVPWPDEPPADDEVPPEDATASSARRSTQQRPPASPGASAPAAARAHPRAASTAPSAAPAQAAAPGPAGSGPAPWGEDVPSPDDEDVEGSNLVGAAVVEQLLGGRVIEEREE